MLASLLATINHVIHQATAWFGLIIIRHIETVPFGVIHHFGSDRDDQAQSHFALVCMNEQQYRRNTVLLRVKTCQWTHGVHSSFVPSGQSVWLSRRRGCCTMATRVVELLGHTTHQPSWMQGLVGGGLGPVLMGTPVWELEWNCSGCHVLSHPATLLSATCALQQSRSAACCPPVLPSRGRWGWASSRLWAARPDNSPGSPVLDPPPIPAPGNPHQHGSVSYFCAIVEFGGCQQFGWPWDQTCRWTGPSQAGQGPEAKAVGTLPSRGCNPTLTLPQHSPSEGRRACA